MATLDPKGLVGILLAVALALAGATGCSAEVSDDPNNPVDPGDPDDPDNPGQPGDPDPWQERLDERVVDYNAALRVAALRLTGNLPTLAEIKFVADAGDQKLAYEALIRSYLEGPRFARQVFSFWQDSLKMGDSPMLDTAAAFAAQVTVEGRPYTDLFTAQSGNCPTFDFASGEFLAGECDNGTPVHAGLLSHPGVHAHYFSNMAFRRVRWVQETFVCTAYPAEVTTPVNVGGPAVYTAPWPFESIAGYANGGDIDFLDVASVACANCHATMNHLAPLLANFNESGTYVGQIAVPKPTEGNPMTELGDWLPEGETTAWRHGVPAADLPALGAAMAADADVAECAVARVWNWAFGKGDIVDTLALVPSEVVAAQTADFIAGGFRITDTIYAVFTSDDFVKF